MCEFGSGGFTVMMVNSGEWHVLVRQSMQWLDSFDVRLCILVLTCVYRICLLFIYYIYLSRLVSHKS